MSSPHQRLDQENVQEQERYERERTVEKYQSRWSSKKTRFIVDTPPSQPRSSHHRQMSGRSCSGSSVKASNEHNYLVTGTSRERSAHGRLQLSNPKWTPPSSLGITDSLPLQPLSCQGAEMPDEEVLLEDSEGSIQNGLPVMGSSPALHHCSRSEQHQQSLSQAMLMNLPASSISRQQMSLKDQRKLVRSAIQLALDIMPATIDAPSFESPRRVPSTASSPRSSNESSRNKR
jgi:hypothetical protein